MKLYSPATVCQIIEKYNFHFQKNFGQNFLIDGNIVNKIVDAAEVSKEDVVLEIGAGIGTLTSALAERVNRVIVIEIDKNLIPILNDTLGGYSNVDIVLGNALKMDFDDLVYEKTGGQSDRGQEPYKIVANLPYYITTPLVMHALESHFNASLMVFMVQKEVAERMVASPGRKDYGALTLGVNYYSEPKMIVRVPKKVFMPQPEVESMVVRLNRREQPPVRVDDEGTFFRVVRAAFGQRRKTLGNALTGIVEGMDKNGVSVLLSSLGIDPGRRGETLSFGEYARITNELFKISKGSPG